jgi:hypothetical protein
MPARRERRTLQLFWRSQTAIAREKDGLEAFTFTREIGARDRFWFSTKMLFAAAILKQKEKIQLTFAFFFLLNGAVYRK